MTKEDFIRRLDEQRQADPARLEARLGFLAEYPEVIDWLINHPPEDLQIFAKLARGEVIAVPSARRVRTTAQGVAAPGSLASPPTQLVDPPFAGPRAFGAGAPPPAGKKTGR